MLPQESSLNSNFDIGSSAVDLDATKPLPNPADATPPSPDTQPAPPSNLPVQPDKEVVIKGKASDELEIETAEKAMLKVSDFADELNKDTQPPTPVKPDVTKPQRDYSVFTDEDKKLLEKSPNPVFDFAKETLPKLYKANKELEAAKKSLDDVKGNILPPSYYLNPEGYTLSKDYKESVTDYRFVDFEETHWKKQLVGLRNGGDSYQHLEGYDKNGKPVLSKVEVPKDKIAEIEAELLSNITAAGSTKQNAWNKIQGIKNNFVTRSNDILNNVKAAEAKYYPMYEKPDDATKKIMADIESLIVPELRDLPLVGMLVKSGTLNVQLVNHIHKLTAELEKSKNRKADLAAAGPGGSEATPSGGTAAKLLSMKDFSD